MFCFGFAPRAPPGGPGVPAVCNCAPSPGEAVGKSSVVPLPYERFLKERGDQLQETHGVRREVPDGHFRAQPQHPLQAKKVTAGMLEGAEPLACWLS